MVETRLLGISGAGAGERRFWWWCADSSCAGSMSHLVGGCKDLIRDSAVFRAMPGTVISSSAVTVQAMGTPENFSMIALAVLGPMFGKDCSKKDW